MSKIHCDKFLNGITHCGRQHYDSATEVISDVTCKDCLRIVEDLKSFDWKAGLDKELALYYNDRVKITYDTQDNPTLVFKYKDESENVKRQAIRFIELYYDELGGKVKFFLKGETIT
jgi:hypothetical protein